MLAFNIKSSKSFGFGHLSRSLKLSESFPKNKIIFFVNNNRESIEILKKKKINFFVFKNNFKKLNKIINENKINIFINDQLRLEKKIINILKKNKIKIINFDEIKNIKNVDLTILPLENRLSLSKRISDLYLRKCLFGPNYISIGNIKVKKRVRKNLKKILIIFGGSDSYNLTFKYLKFIDLKKFKVTLIFGPLVKKKQIRLKNIKIIFNVKNLFKEYYKNDLLITGGGMIPYEAAMTGLPSFIISTENHEKKTGVFFNKENCGVYIGHKNKIKYFFEDNINIENLSYNCINKIKPNGNFLIKKQIDKMINEKKKQNTITI